MNKIIKYIDDKGVVFKEIKMQTKLEISKEGKLSKWRLVYRDVSEITMPAWFIAFILALLL